MKRWLWILAGALVLLGGTQEDRRLENLRPAELISIRESAGLVQVETDTGERGRGRTLDQALEDLKNRAAGRVLLDTVDQLVVTREALWTLDQAGRIFRPVTEAVMGAGNIDPAKAAAYLRIHRGGWMLKDRYENSGQMPVLRGEKDGYRIE